MTKFNFQKINNFSKKTLRNTVLVLFLCLSLFPTNVYKAEASTLEELQQELSNLNKQISEINARLKEKRSEKATLQGEIAIFDDQIYAINLQIWASDREINKTQAEIDRILAEIKQAEDDLLKQKEVLKENIRVFYEEGQITSIEVIASSDNFSEYMDRSEYLRSLQEKIVETVDKINILKKELEEKQKGMETKKAELLAVKNQQESQRQALANQKAAKDNLLAATRGEEKEFQNQLNVKRETEAKFFAAYLAAIASQSGNNKSNYKGGAGSGYLQMPSNGFLTQGYGCTDFAQCGNPYGPYGGKIHNGLDISYGYSGPIFAAAEGTVLGIGPTPSGGWGNWIAIQHPNGLVTLYTHLSSFNVGAGQNVTKGQVIGLEGNTGFSTGSHLHFSVYTNFVLYGNIPGYDGTVNPYTFL